MLLTFLGIGEAVANAIKKGITGLFLTIDGVVYWIIGNLYDLYVSIAAVEFNTNDIYKDIANRFLVIIGVVMLFYLAYALLKALVNPDEGIKATSKIVTNLIISLVLIAVVPTIFTYAFRAQNIIIKDNIIDKIVFGNSDNTIASIGKTTAMNFFDAFVDADDVVIDDDYGTWGQLKKCIPNNQASGCDGSEGFRYIALLTDPVVDGKADYIILVSTVCGCFLVYVIASFCIDLGIRVVKLAFYQIISPIPIMMRIIPEKKSVFDNWVKATIATYLEVFIRIFIMYMISFLCSEIFNAGVLNSYNLNIWGTLVIIMGLFAFAKQAPKLISEMTGIDSGNMKLGIRDKLATGGALTAGAFIGGGLLAGTRNATNGVSNAWKQGKMDVQNANGGWNKFKAGFKGTVKGGWNTARSTAAGFTRGAFSAGRAGVNAKKYEDVAKAASSGAKAAVDARDTRDAYIVSHGGMLGAMGGRVTDALNKAKEFAGISIGTEGIKKELDIYTKGAEYKKRLEDLAMKKNTKAKLYSQQMDALNQEAINLSDYTSREIARMGDFNDFLKRADIRKKYDIDKIRNEAAKTLNRINYASDEEYNAAVDELAIKNRDAAIRKEYDDTIRLNAQMAYKTAINERANQIDQLRRAKDFEIIKTVNQKLSNIDDPANADFAEIVKDFETYQKQNITMEGMDAIHNLTGNWDPDWDSQYDAMTISKDDLKKIKNAVNYTSNHDKLDAKKKEKAVQYADRIKKEQEKK